MRNLVGNLIMALSCMFIIMNVTGFENIDFIQIENEMNHLYSDLSQYQSVKQHLENDLNSKWEF